MYIIDESIIKELEDVYDHKIVNTTNRYVITSFPKWLHIETIEGIEDLLGVTYVERTRTPTNLDYIMWRINK